MSVFYDAYQFLNEINSLDWSGWNMLLVEAPTSKLKSPSDLFTATDAGRVNRADNQVKILKYSIDNADPARYGKGYKIIEYKVLADPTRENDVHYGYIVFFSSNRKIREVWCNCKDFFFRLYYAYVQAGLSTYNLDAAYQKYLTKDAELAKEPANITNPENTLFLCKHLYKIAKSVLDMSNLEISNLEKVTTAKVAKGAVHKAEEENPKEEPKVSKEVPEEKPTEEPKEEPETNEPEKKEPEETPKETPEEKKPEVDKSKPLRKEPEKKLVVNKGGAGKKEMTQADINKEYKKKPTTMAAPAKKKPIVKKATAVDQLKKREEPTWGKPKEKKVLQKKKEVPKTMAVQKKEKKPKAKTSTELKALRNTRDKSM